MSDSDIKLDFQRKDRLGLDEAILCLHKTVRQLTSILDQAEQKVASLLLTRLNETQFGALPERHRERINYEPVSLTGYYGAVLQAPSRDPAVAVIAAGTSDIPVSRETVRTLNYYNEGCLEISDVGVAGLWRLLDRVDEIQKIPIIIVVAGMDAALPSVIGGLLPGLVIAVPTSKGYGIAQSGETALRSMLVSCAPGVVVTNIDNGYGAACAALRALHAFR